MAKTGGDIFHSPHRNIALDTMIPLVSIGFTARTRISTPWPWTARRFPAASSWIDSMGCRDTCSPCWRPTATPSASGGAQVDRGKKWWGKHVKMGIGGNHKVEFGIWRFNQDGDFEATNMWRRCRNDGNWMKGTRNGWIVRFIKQLVRWMIGMWLGIYNGGNRVQETKPLGTIWLPHI